eukprot:TRINITY_DN739_c0_g1_i1.p1 TRINITY_DN739_c0_g1~~TRINITY_DN739_c0_g1_i1.p1  ORF type:complete len:71 (-),score=33.26 TRINITY_DN739_c0_g1_i1:96-281(-)
MNSANSLILFSFAIILAFISPVKAATAWDAGDTIALILGLVVGFVAICAFLGWWGRRKGEV